MGADSNDKGRMEEAKEEMTSLLQTPELADAVVLVFANKQDLPGALSPSEVSAALDLPSLTHSWYIQGCCGVLWRGPLRGPRLAFRCPWLLSHSFSHEGVVVNGEV